MKLQLKKVKCFDEMSEETPSWTAELYMDGKKVATVRGAGQGGSTDVCYTEECRSEEVQKLEEYAKKHPLVLEFQGRVFKFYGVSHVVDALFGKWLDKHFK